jgi:hypothetical protein
VHGAARDRSRHAAQCDVQQTNGVSGDRDSIVGLGFYLPVVGLLCSIVSFVLVAVWHSLIGWRLIQLGSSSRR